MVDVSSKSPTTRTAQATARFCAHPDAVTALRTTGGPKGEALATARIAGILAAKRTAHLIPLCHNLALDHIHVTIEPDGDDALLVRASARTTARTGVEMEALVAASVAALTLYDMAKALDRGARIGPVQLAHKSGGKSGDYHRPAD